MEPIKDQAIEFFSNYAELWPILAMIYAIPTIIALLRLHRNLAAIAIVNTFLGWTFLGWVATLAWSVAAGTRR